MKKYILLTSLLANLSIFCAMPILKKSTKTHYTNDLINAINKKNEPKIIQILNTGLKPTKEVIKAAIIKKLSNKTIESILKAHTPSLRHALVVALSIPRKDKEETVKLLVHHGAKPYESLAEAIRFNFSTSMIEFLLEKGAKLDWYALNEAIKKNNIKLLDLLLNKGTKPSSSVLSSILTEATKENNMDIKIIELLIKNGAKPDSNSLEKAVEKNNLTLIKLLIKNGAKPDSNSLEKAVEKNDLTLIKLLIKNGAKPTKTYLTKLPKNINPLISHLLWNAHGPQYWNFQKQKTSNYEKLETQKIPNQMAISEALKQLIKRKKNDIKE